MKLFFIIGYDSVLIPLLREVLQGEAKEHEFEFRIVSDSGCNDYIDEIENCDALFVYSRNLPEEVVEIVEKTKAKVVISIFSEYPSKIKSDSFLKARELWLTAGKENFSALVHLILRELGLEIEVPEVKKVPWHGIYYPELGIFEDVEQYLEKYEKRPLVGIIAYRNHILFGKAEYLNELIKEIEKAGLGVVAIFTRKHKDEFVEIPDVSESINKFFFKDGKPIVDAIVNLSYFSLLKGKIEVLMNLGLPVISPITSFYMTLEEWLEKDSIDYLSQVYNVIMPEIDGLIEPIPYSFPVIGETKDYKPFKAHAELIARRVRKWVDLRRKKVSERKIAIVLINPPCKNLESSIGVGLGLDVPESVVRLLKKLKDLGYSVENEPENGKELINLFLSKKAISEFRWTSVEEVVAKGGVIGFVDYDSYISWLKELPENAVKKLIKDWGDPAEVLAKKVKKELVGMVYEGKFVIPGLRFGNVVVLTQPKFGCAGSACDGRVCRILHDPTITPPHQWIAVYRWITRVFGADILVHFGTHGYLEFRPGKGVGLSPSCWPEISIDDVPHLYVYAVSNPMEGVIAKRRSYATIVDHIYPPMIMADVFEDIESLLSQFAHAKSLGDLLRAEKIYKELLEKAKSANIPLKVKEPEKVVEELHRYVTSCRETQIELGLHIFGSSDREKAAEYTITSMAKDTHSYPSIRRVLAEYLGLDYDELMEKPMEINKLGMTNIETMRFLQKAALRILERLVEMGFSSKSIDFEVLKQLLKEVIGFEPGISERC